MSPSILKGSIYMIICFFFVALFGLFLKLAATAEGTTIWPTFLAYISAWVCMLVWTAKEGLSFLKPKRPFVIIWRALFGALATLLYVIALQRIPLVNATLLFNTTPLFIPLLALVFFRRRVPAIAWLSILVGFAGIIFIIRPREDIYSSIGDWIGLASGFSLAIAFIIVGILTRTEPLKRINFYFFLIGSLVFVPWLVFLPSLPSLPTFLWSLAAGGAFVLTQYFLVKAYSHAEPHEVGALQYSSVVFAGFFDWAIWHKVPTLFTFIGILLVIIGGALTIFLSKKPKQ